MAEATVELYLDPLAFVINAGAPHGRDDVHRTICRWPGWRRVPAGPRATHSRYVAPPWPSSVLSIRSTPAVALAWTREAAELRDRVCDAATRAKRLLDGFEGLLPFPVHNARRQPMPHQRRAVAAMRAMEWRTLLADDMGLGKTASACWALDDSGATRAIVLCPVSVKRNWIREIDLALGEGHRSILIDGTAKKRANQLADVEFANRDTSADRELVIVVCNYDLLIHLTDEQVQTLRRFACGAFLICDESHALKNRNSQRTKFVRDVFKQTSSRLLLTGTPVRNTVEDLYSQITIIRPGTWSSYSDFAKRHLVIQSVDFGKRTALKVMGSKNLDALNAVVNTVQVRRKKEDVLDLPPKTLTIPELTLCDITKSVYKAMKDFAVLQLSQLDPGTSIFDPRAGSAVEAAMRCEQICQGFVGGIPEPLMNSLSKAALKAAVRIPGRPNELLFPRSPKITWLLETIQAIKAQGGAPVVFSRFNAPMQWLGPHLRTLGVSSTWLHGGLSSEGKDNAVQLFQDCGADVFLCQVKMAEGFNLVRSQDVIFFGRDWSPAVNVQAEDRCHRIGQRGTVNIQIPIVLKTVEWPIHNRLIAKAADAANALRNVTIEELAESL